MRAVQHPRLFAAAVAAWLGGSAAACVDTGPRRQPGSGPGGGPPPTCEAQPPVPYAGGAVIPSEDTPIPGQETPPYTWKNAVIKGGGFVSGIITSPVLPGLVFARTDVGGAYRHDPANWRQAGFFNNSVLTVGKTP